MSAPLASYEWEKVRKWAEERISETHKRLESALDPIATAQERGRIKALRSLIEWGEPEPAPEIDTPPPY